MNAQVPVIPEKLYFTIGEVSKLINTPTHSIRYWEKEDARNRYGVIKTKRSKENDRRVYARDVVLTLYQLKTLIADHEHTVPGALKLLSNNRKTKALKPSESRFVAALKMVETKLERVLNDIA
jgi:DNA-binding transcriptional MerR regulator